MPNRIDEIRGRLSYQAIADRLLERVGVATNASTIRKLAVGEMQLSEKWLRQLGAALDVSAGEILDPPAGDTDAGLHDAEAVRLDLADYPEFAALAAAPRQLWRAEADTLAELHISAGDLLIVDTAPATLAGVRSGDSVIATFSPGTKPVFLLRQFIEPQLLTCNSVKVNRKGCYLQTDNAHIVALVLHHVRSARA